MPAAVKRFTEVGGSKSSDTVPYECVVYASSRAGVLRGVCRTRTRSEFANMFICLVECNRDRRE